MKSQDVQIGVADGIFRIATNATDMPCADFYDAIKEGVRDAVIRIAFHGCICPPTSEQTCQGEDCPRKP